MIYVRALFTGEYVGDFLPNSVEDEAGTRSDRTATFAEPHYPANEAFYLFGNDAEVYCEMMAESTDIQEASDWASPGKQRHALRPFIPEP